MRMYGHRRSAWALLLLAVTALPAAAQSSEDSARAVHLLRRATWGARPVDITAVLSAGRDAWLERQLQPTRIEDDATNARLREMPLITASMSQLYRDFSPLPGQAAAALAAQQMMNDSMRAAGVRPPNTLTAAERRERQMRSPQRLLQELIAAKITRSIYTERQLEDVMTDFWFNHFNVFFNKGQDRYFVSDYERNAIRPHVFGRFEDMLLATAQHPAMLFYLDNAQSVYVDSAAMRRRPGQQQNQRSRGLNENYARELLELHTLGVDGGYTQKDVIEVARAFTGWGFQQPNVRTLQTMEGDNLPPVSFLFRPQMHDPGTKVILGQTLPAGRGVEDGRDVIRMLAKHPSTARFIATKLAERFVADDPPADVVAHLAEVFTRTNGDLRAVTRALFSNEHFYRPQYRATKVKTPYELVVSALRVTGADVTASRRAMELLRTMGHLPYTEPTPTGFPAMSEDWVNSGAMLNRMNFGLDLAAGRVDGARINPATLSANQRAEPLPALLAAVLPAMDTQRLAERIREDAQQQADAQPRARIARALGLALGSPEFQKR
jgi:uncharacterized protein (DUF1800 family)